MGSYTNGTLGQDGDTVVISGPGDMGTVAIQITGTFSGTILFEGSIDGGITYVGRVASSGSTIATSATTTGNWRSNVAGYTNFRVRMHPYTSGSASIVLRYAEAVNDVTVVNASTLGQQTSASSTSVVIASDNTPTVLQSYTAITTTPNAITGTSTYLVGSAGGGVDLANYRWVSLQLSGTFTATFVVAISNDNTNWINFPLSQVMGAAGIGYPTSILHTGIYQGPVHARYMRISCSSFGSNASLGATMYAWATPPALYGASNFFRRLSTNDTNSAAVSVNPAQLNSWNIYNSGGAVAFVKIYNKASAPTVGTDVPGLTIAVLAGGVATYTSREGMSFSSGIGLGITGAVADADTTAVAANQVVVVLEYR